MKNKNNSNSCLKISVAPTFRLLANSNRQDEWDNRNQITAPDTSQNQLSSDVIARPQSVAVTAEAGRPVPADAGDAADSISLTHISLTCSGHFPLRAIAPVYCSLLARAAPCCTAPHRTISCRNFDE